MKIANSVREITRKMLADVAKIDKQIEDLQNHASIYTNEYLAQEKQKLQNKKAEIISSGKSDVDALASMYRADVKKRYKIEASEELTKLSSILNAGFAFTAAELDAMVDEYAAVSPALVRLIGDYANKNGVKLSRSIKTEQEASSFADTMVQYYNCAASRPQFADVWDSDDYFVNISQGEE